MSEQPAQENPKSGRNTLYLAAAIVACGLGIHLHNNHRYAQQEAAKTSAGLVCQDTDSAYQITDNYNHETISFAGVANPQTQNGFVDGPETGTVSFTAYLKPYPILISMSTLDGSDAPFDDILKISGLRNDSGQADLVREDVQDCLKKNNENLGSHLYFAPETPQAWVKLPQFSKPAAG